MNKKQYESVFNIEFFESDIKIEHIIKRSSF